MNYLRKETESVGIDLRDIRWQELYLLKYRQQIILAIVVMIVLFLILYWIVLSPLVNELAVERDKENTLKQTYSINVNKLASMPTLQKEIKDIKKSSENLLSQLPKDFSAANIVQEFYESGAKNGLRINVNKHLKIEERDNLIIRPYEIETTGTYSQLERFCLDLSKLNTLVILTDFRLSSENQSSNVKSKELLRLKVVASTYQTKESKE